MLGGVSQRWHRHDFSVHGGFPPHQHQQTRPGAACEPAPVGPAGSRVAFLAAAEQRRSWSHSRERASISAQPAPPAWVCSVCEERCASETEACTGRVCTQSPRFPGYSVLPQVKMGLLGFLSTLSPVTIDVHRPGPTALPGLATCPGTAILPSEQQLSVPLSLGSGGGCALVTSLLS